MAFLIGGFGEIRFINGYQQNYLWQTSLLHQDCNRISYLMYQKDKKHRLKPYSSLISTSRFFGVNT